MANLKDLEKQVKELVELTSGKSIFDQLRVQQENNLKFMSMGVEIKGKDEKAYLEHIVSELKDIRKGKCDINLELGMLIEEIEGRIQ